MANEKKTPTTKGLHLSIKRETAEKLDALRGKITLLKAETTLLEAQLHLDVAKSMMEVGCNPLRSMLCYDCESVLPKSLDRCPVCVE